MDRSAQPNSWAFEAALCLLAPFFFLSTIFSILAPLPILYLHQGFPNRRRARIWALAAIPIGCGVSLAVGGALMALGFFLFAALPAVLIGELFEQRFSVESTISITTLVVFCLTLGGGAALLHEEGQKFLPTAETKVIGYVKTLTTELLERQKGALPDPSQKDIERIAEDPSLVLREALGLLLAGILLLTSLPIIALLRWNPKNFQGRLGLKRDFIRRWASPEWLIWPAIFCLAFLIFEVRYLSFVATNLLKPLLLIYFFHGMSILSFYLDLFRVRGLVRILFYGLAIFFLAPMIVSFGFFDLWFKFRERARPVESPRA